ISPFSVRSKQPQAKRTPRTTNIPNKQQNPEARRSQQGSEEWRGGEHPRRAKRCRRSPSPAQLDKPPRTKQSQDTRGACSPLTLNSASELTAPSLGEGRSSFAPADHSVSLRITFAAVI